MQVFQRLGENNFTCNLQHPAKTFRHVPAEKRCPSKNKRKMAIQRVRGPSRDSVCMFMISSVRSALLVSTFSAFLWLYVLCGWRQTGWNVNVATCDPQWSTLLVVSTSLHAKFEL